GEAVPRRGHLHAPAAGAGGVPAKGPERRLRPFLAGLPLPGAGQQGPGGPATAGGDPPAAGRQAVRGAAEVADHGGRRGGTARAALASYRSPRRHPTLVPTRSVGTRPRE